MTDSPFHGFGQTRHFIRWRGLVSRGGITGRRPAIGRVRDPWPRLLPPEDVSEPGETVIEPIRQLEETTLFVTQRRDNTRHRGTVPPAGEQLAGVQRGLECLGCRPLTTGTPMCWAST